MRIQYFNGGLANQVFQYIFYRFNEIRHPEKDVWFLDDSFFYFKKEHNGYELERIFGIKPNLLSSQFDPAAWDAIIKVRKEGKSVAEFFRNAGMAVIMLAETDNYKQTNQFNGQLYRIPANEFHPEITELNLPKDHILYYHGYWINREWFHTYRDILMEELQFPVITEPHNQKYASAIKNSFSVGIHIRRGDYVTLGWNMEKEYYYNASKQMIANVPDLTYFVFSDDLQWCRENEEELGLSLAKKIVYIEGNTGENSFRDLQLMAMCNGLIMSNSAFCYLAALLNPGLSLYVNPSPVRKI